MSSNEYLKWLTHSTKSNWWVDSAVLGEMDQAIANGATGVTSNPVLVKRSLFGHTETWRSYLQDLPTGSDPSIRAEEIIRRITTALAEKFEPIFRSTKGEQGYVCSQVIPSKAGDAGIMLDMARRLHGWAPNIAVKLPVTKAGLDVLETCIAEGITVTATVSFTVPQVLAVAERHMAGLKKAEEKGIEGGHCFAVVMVGRIDDYLRDVAHDRQANVLEGDIIKAGTAVIKRAYKIFGQKGYKAVLMPAGMRGGYHATDLVGAGMSMSIAANIQKMLQDEPRPWEEHIHDEIPEDTIERLMTLHEFARAYEPDGMQPEDFITYGVTQKTLSQFSEAGWTPIEGFTL